MPHFSLSEELAAREPWTIEIRGKVFTARPVSRLQILDWLVAIAERPMDSRKVERAIKAALRCAFPARWRYGLPWAIDPVQEILQADVVARTKVLDSFFEFARAQIALGLQMSGRSDGSPSSVAPRPSPSASA